MSINVSVADGTRGPRLGDLVSLQDFAAAAGVAPDTVYAYKNRGYLPEPVGHVDRTPLWTRKQLQTWLRSRPGQGKKRAALS